MRYYHKSLKVGSWEGGLKAVLGGESILGRSKVGW